jgi:PAS domain S-box-containing protein
MRQQEPQSTQLTRIKRRAVILIIAWTCIIFVSALWSLYSSNQAVLTLESIRHGILFGHSLLWGFGLFGIALASRRIFADMRRQKEAAQVLYERAKQYKAITSTSMDGFWVIAPDGRLLDVNAAYCRMLGYSQDELLTMYVFDIETQKLPEEIQAHIQQVMETGTDRFETHHRRKDGRLIDVEVSTIFVAESGYFCSFLRDITARKQPETALRESEKRLRQVIENMPMMLDAFDGNNNIIAWNRECERVTGYSAEEMVGNPRAMELLYPDAEYREAIIAEQAELGLDFCNKEYTLTGKYGTKKTVSWSNISARYPIPGWDTWAIGVDVTERKRVEKTLQQERDKAQQYFDLAGVMFVALDATGAVALINHRGSHILGGEPQEIIGENWFETFLPVNARAQTRTIFDQLMRGEVEPVEYYENPVLTKGGEERLIAWHNTLLRDDTGQIVGTLSSGEDITERKQAEQILQVRLRLSEYAITHSIENLMQKTLDEAEQLTNSQIGFFHFLEADQKTLTLQVWSTNTLTTMCSAEGAGLHYPVDEAGVWVDCIQQHVPVIHNDYASLPHRQGMPEGHAEIIRELVVPIMRNDLIVGILGMGNKPTDYDATDIKIIDQLANMAWDIVAHKKVELELGRSEETIALKDRFISTVSHEFRTPLAIIQTSSDLLMHYADKLTEARRQQSFHQITQQIAVLTGLIDGVLSISRSQTGRIEFAPTPVDLEPFCRTIFEQIQFTDKSEHQFEFVSHAPDQLVLVDGTLLQHILTNLLTNAVKYSPEKSRITFELKYNKTDIIIKVSDEGIGIPEADLALLFEPFHRASNVGHAAGTGLGLSIVNEYVALHGGRVEMESQLGAGSTFTILLPLK